MANLQTRVMNILRTPATEWPVIAAESTDIGRLYAEYIIPLSAIPVIAGFVGMAILTSSIGLRTPMTTALGWAVVQYVMGLASVFICAIVIEWLAPKFKSSGSRVDAMKLVAYAATASWVAGVGAVIPGLGLLIGLVGFIYAIYLFYLGLPHVMKTPADQVVIYMIVCAVVIILVNILLGMITAALTLGGTIASSTL